MLSDNATVFCSATLGDMLKKWNVLQFFRATYRLRSNGIVDRNHQNIKTVAERGGISSHHNRLCFGTICPLNLDKTRKLFHMYQYIDMPGDIQRLNQAKSPWLTLRQTGTSIKLKVISKFLLFAKTRFERCDSVSSIAS